jgi:hypothetical protein
LAAPSMLHGSRCCTQGLTYHLTSLRNGETPPFNSLPSILVRGLLWTHHYASVPQPKWRMFTESFHGDTAQTPEAIILASIADMGYNPHETLYSLLDNLMRQWPHSSGWNHTHTNHQC